MLKVKSFNTKSHGKQAVIYCAINTSQGIAFKNKYMFKTTGWLQG